MSAKILGAPGGRAIDLYKKNTSAVLRKRNKNTPNCHQTAAARGLFTPNKILISLKSFLRERYVSWMFVVKRMSIR